MAMRRGYLLLVVCSVTWYGCGRANTGHVTGRVTLGGAPREHVTVIFRSDTGAASSGVTDRDGHYELRPPPIVGNHHVTLETYRITRDDQGNPVEYPETLPARYNKDSKLVRSVAAGKQTIDFELESHAKNASSYGS